MNVRLVDPGRMEMPQGVTNAFSARLEPFKRKVGRLLAMRVPPGTFVPKDRVCLRHALLVHITERPGKRAKVPVSYVERGRIAMSLGRVTLPSARKDPTV